MPRYTVIAKTAVISMQPRSLYPIQYGKGSYRWELKSLSLVGMTIMPLQALTFLYGFNLPKIGQISAGIRYENVHYTYLDAVTPANNLSHNYGTWFPTFSFAGKVGKVQLMLNYSARTRRPNYAQLSSAISYDNRYLLQSGNAQLQPELIHNVSATAVWKFLTFMVNYSRTNDPIMTWSSPYNDEGVILVKPRNIDSPFRMLVAYGMLNHTIGVWTMSYTLGIQKQWLTINAPDPRMASTFQRLVKSAQAYVTRTYITHILA